MRSEKMSASTNNREAMWGREIELLIKQVSALPSEATWPVASAREYSLDSDVIVLK